MNEVSTVSFPIEFIICQDKTECIENKICLNINKIKTCPISIRNLIVYLVGLVKIIDYLFLQVPRKMGCYTP